MPFINVAKKILETYDMWPIKPTFYTVWAIDDDLRVYVFGCHFGHTDVRIKISLREILLE